MQLLRKGEGASIVGSHPELEMAISNIPAKYQKIALKANQPVQQPTPHTHFQWENKFWTNCASSRSKSSQSVANNPKRVSSNGRVKNSKNNILSGSINHGRRSSQVNDYSDGEVIFKKKNKYQLKTLALNSDIKADLDISGSHSSQRISPKRPKYFIVRGKRHRKAITYKVFELIVSL